MKIAYIGTYPPRECGIGTFTRNLFFSMSKNNTTQNDSIEKFIVAINDHDETYNYPEEVKLSIKQDHQQDYLMAAEFINRSGADICILEHEFGIFGGQSGVYILPLLHRLEIPLIVTLHSILKSPSYSQKAVVKEICIMANKIVVMSLKAINFLENIYQVPSKKINFIEHGVPDILFDQQESKNELNLVNKKVLLTFGLVARNKGIETVIKALPHIIKKHPNIIYLVLGKTHPNVLRYEGEEYRNYLRLLVKKLNLDEHVSFLNEFVSQNELFKYLCSSDIYITPYLNEAQITSGTLSYAVGVGSAVISTPYWHAVELLDNGRGRLFQFNDSNELSTIIMELLDKPKVLKNIREKAFKYGREIVWPKIGDKYISLSQKILDEKPLVSVKKTPHLDPFILPPFSLEHISRLTDDTGIIQHAKYGIPNLKEGYTLDDNARALLMVTMAYRQKKDFFSLELAPIYLSYILYMQKNDGTFRNFLSFNRNFLDEVGSEDSFGRTIWALGYLISNPLNDSFSQTSKEIFLNASPNFEKLKSIRSIANTIIGICYYLRNNPSDNSMTEKLKILTNKIINNYKENSSTKWKWFEKSFAYDNGILPLALLHATEILNDSKIREVAIGTMNFLSNLTIKEGYLSIIGNNKWYSENGERSVFAQQPIDALAMILMFYQAFRLTKEKGYLEKLFTSFMWFLGENDLRMSLFDFETKGCCDGIEEYGINRNQGAESTIAYLISHLTILEAFEESSKWS